MMKIIGIDYSLTCPAICISSGNSYNESEFFYLTDNKKHADVYDRAQGSFHKEYKTEQERYDNIARFFMSKLPPPKECKIFIEDYSFGSRGKVFHIAENCGILKHKLWEAGYTFECVPPTVIKKHATGKGNADKEKMVAAFKELTGVDLHDMILGSRKLASPVSDIVDAFYIASYGYSK